MNNIFIMRNDTLDLNIPSSVVARAVCNYAVSVEKTIKHSVINEKVDYLVLSFTSLRSCHRVAELISSIIGVPCSWHNSFGALYENPFSKDKNKISSLDEEIRDKFIS